MYDLAWKVAKQLWFQADIALAQLMFVYITVKIIIYKLPFNIVMFVFIKYSTIPVGGHLQQFFLNIIIFKVT